MENPAVKSEGDAVRTGEEEGVEEEEVSVTDTVLVSSDHRDLLIEQLEQLRLDMGYTDLTITIDGHRFPCHKVVLAAGSPYFRTMFASGMEESRQKVIEMKQIDAAVFRQVLRFIYTGRVDIGGATVQELFTQAQMFQIAPLVEQCVTFFQDCMNVDNCLAAMTLADTHNHSAMYEFAKRFACLHFTTVTADDDFLRLSVECVADLLRDRRLNCSTEEQVYEAAVRWLDQDPQRKQQHTYRVLKCIKFPLVNRSYLMDILSAGHHLSPEQGRELLDSALLYHTVPSRRHMLPSFQITPRLCFPYFECAILLGGRLGEGLSNEVECFRSDTGHFSPLKALPFKKRNEFAACAVGDEIFVSGGLRSGEFWKYDPTFESWLRGASMIKPRRRHAMAAVDDTIFVLGGFDEEQVLDSVEVWERKTNKWEECSQTGHSNVENMGFVAHGKQIFLFGGKNSEEVVTNLVQCFHTATRQCTLCSNPLPANDMCVSATILNGRIFVVGLEGFFSYQPESDWWQVLEDMLLPRDFVSLCVLDEKLYAFGGRRRGAKDNLYSDSIEVYDPATGVWSNAGQTPVPMYSYGCVRVFLSVPPKNKRLSQCISGGVDGTVRN